MTRSMIRSPFPLRITLVALLVVALAFAGCHDIGGTTRPHASLGDGQGGAEDREPVDGPTAEATPKENETIDEPAPPQRIELELEWEPVAEPVYTGQVLELVFAASGEEAVVDWRGVRWSQESTAMAALDDLASSDFEGAQEARGADHTVPGTFTVDWTPPGAQTYHLRVHVVADGYDHWSSEIELDVIPAVEKGDFEADETMRMRTNLLDPCEGDSYSEDVLEIAPGTVVEWTNAASCPHTAMHDASAPLWSTGQLEPNDTSSSFRFNKPGTYEVRCGNHPGMTQEIVVG